MRPCLIASGDTIWKTLPNGQMSRIDRGSVTKVVATEMKRGRSVTVYRPTCEVKRGRSSILGDMPANLSLKQKLTFQLSAAFDIGKLQVQPGAGVQYETGDKGVKFPFIIEFSQQNKPYTP